MEDMVCRKENQRLTVCRRYSLDLQAKTEEDLQKATHRDT